MVCRRELAARIAISEIEIHGAICALAPERFERPEIDHSVTLRINRRKDGGRDWDIERPGARSEQQ